MTRTRPDQLAFSSGEIDPLLHLRTDWQRWRTGLARCRGFLPLAQGGFTRAPGTLWRGRTRGDAGAVLIPFVFAENDAAVLEFTPLRMRVWRYGALVMSGGVPYELTTPYDADDLAGLSWVQSADVLYLADGARPVQRLARLALDDWTIGPLVLDTGPFRVQNLDTALTLQASAETGTVTLTASAPVFLSGHVGALFRLEPTDFTTIPQWEGNVAVAVGDLRRYDGQIYRLAAGTNTGVTPPTHREGTALTGAGVSWEHISDGTGIVRITAVASATSAAATVVKRIPRACVDDPTHRWAEGAWSSVRGWPALLELYEQRLVAAATPSEPRTLWFSTVGDFADFEPSVEPDGSFAYTIDGGETQNRVQAIKRGRTGLHVLALGEEYSTRSDAQGSPIGPTTAVFRLDGSNGAARARPIAPDGKPIFITRDRRRILVVGWSLEDDANRATELSLPARHLGAGGFAQIVWQSAPQRIAWIRRDTGDLAAMVYEPDEDVLGWAVVTLAGGHVEAMAVTPSPDGAADIVTLVVRRVLGGQTVRSIEELATVYGTLSGDEPISEAVHFYAAARFAASPPAATFMVPHLAGEAVHVWTEIGAFGPLTVAAGGAVTLPVPVARATVGLLDATHEVETLDIRAAAPDGSTLGRRKRLHSGAGIGVYRTAQGLIAAVERTLGQSPRVLPPNFATIVPVPVAAPLTEVQTGVVRVTLPSGHAEEVALRIRPWSGAPLTVTAIVPVVQEAGP